MADAQRKWGVTQVIVRYVSGDDTWEMTLDPKKVDALVFNWERFKKINEVVGRPLPGDNHLRPDGKRVRGDEPADEVARKMGINGPPRRVGPREGGTSEDPICLHSVDCVWWCLSESHTHGDEGGGGPK